VDDSHQPATRSRLPLRSAATSTAAGRKICAPRPWSRT